MWSRHLSREARLAVADGHGGVEDRDHVGRCERCRRDVEVLQATVAAMRAVDVPEPSPLFWDHLSARISRAIAREEVPASPLPGSAAPAWRSGMWLAGAAVAAALAVMVTWTPDERAASSALSVTSGEAGPATGATALDPDPTGWEFLVTLAVVTDEDSSGELMGDVQPGTADRALLALSDAEREALAGLLEVEIRQPSS